MPVSIITIAAIVALISLLIVLLSVMKCKNQLLFAATIVFAISVTVFLIGVFYYV